MSAARHLSQDQARRLTLALQHLSVPAAAPMDVVRRLTAVQTQIPSSLPNALWVRTRNVTPAWIESSLNITRDLVRVWTFRETLHTISSGDLPLHVAAIGLSRQEHLVRRYVEKLGYTEAGVERVFQAILDALADGPLTRQELHARVPELMSVTSTIAGLDIKGLVFRGQVVFSESRNPSTPRFALRSQWLPHIAFDVPDRIDAGAAIAMNFVRGCAPVSPADVRTWMGMLVPEFNPVWKRIVTELIPVTIEGLRGTHYIHPGDLEFLDALPDAPPVSLLPKFDAYVLAHTAKERIVEKAYYKQIFRISAQIEAVVLVDGEIVGTWRSKPTGRRLTFTFEIFRALSKALQGRIVSEAEKFAIWSGYQSAESNFMVP